MSSVCAVAVAIFINLLIYFYLWINRQNGCSLSSFWHNRMSFWLAHSYSLWWYTNIFKIKHNVWMTYIHHTLQHCCNIMFDGSGQGHKKLIDSWRHWYGNCLCGHSQNLKSLITFVSVDFNAVRVHIILMVSTTRRIENTWRISLVMKISKN